MKESHWKFKLDHSGCVRLGGSTTGHGRNPSLVELHVALVVGEHEGKRRTENALFFLAATILISNCQSQSIFANQGSDEEACWEYCRNNQRFMVKI